MSDVSHTSSRRAPSRPEGAVHELASEFCSVFTRMRSYRFSGEWRCCELCGGRSHDIVGRRDRYGQRLTTVLCRGCGLVFTNPMPTRNEVDGFYRWHYRKHYHNADQPRCKAVAKALKGAASRYERLKPILPERGRVIDLGSGGGEFVHVLRQNGVDAWGVEPNLGFARYAREQYGVPIKLGGWQDARVIEGSVAVISANHVLEHFRDPLAALTRMRAWLRPDGLLHLAVPNVENPEKTPYGRFHFAHLFNFNNPSFVMMTRKAGFEPIANDGSNDLIFRSMAEPPSDWMLFPDNYERLARFFAEHTNRRYFLTTKPYRRWVRRMRRLSGNMARVYLRG